MTVPVAVPVAAGLAAGAAWCLLVLVFVVHRRLERRRWRSRRPTITPAEFRDFGYLAEVNRCVLHPLGLAASVSVDRRGRVTLGPIYDDRDDLEGVRYEGAEVERREKYDRVHVEWRRRFYVRRDVLGYMVQPPPNPARTQDRDAPHA